MSIPPEPRSVSAVVCSWNSISSIRPCLESLREAGVGEVIVVDAYSTDGTREVASNFADQVLDDAGLGLGNARNIGIAASSKPLILNMGSDNVMPPEQLQLMIETLIGQNLHGVSARTVIEGDSFVSRGLNSWRKSRFRPGPAEVIGTPTLFIGDLLRSQPFDGSRRFSDDSELCERWHRIYGARFAIADAFVTEIGKTSWPEVVVRCRMYGISDEEVFRIGRQEGWSLKRQMMSLLHPLRSDFLTPMEHLGLREALVSAPFLTAFTAMRYGFWIRAALGRALPI